MYKLFIDLVFFMLWIFSQCAIANKRFIQVSALKCVSRPLGAGLSIGTTLNRRNKAIDFKDGQRTIQTLIDGIDFRYNGILKHFLIVYQKKK